MTTDTQKATAMTNAFHPFIRDHDVVDCNGRPVTESESPEKIIPVWHVEPCLHTTDGDFVRIRGWQEMIRYLENCMDLYLERFTDEESRAGVTVTVKLVDMRLDDYQDMTQGDL